LKNAFYILILTLLFSSCKKEEEKHTVSYKVIVTSGHPVYSVSYSSSNNSTQSLGSITSSTWTSGIIDDRRGGTSVFLTLTGGSGGSYKMFIYIDGSLQKDGHMDDPYGPLTIEAAIPD
jgi:hypothetical protein